MSDDYGFVRSHSRRALLRYAVSGAIATSAGAGLARALAQEGKRDPFRPNGPINVFDYQKLAEEALPPAHYGYLQTGVFDDASVRANVAGYSKFGLRPRRLAYGDPTDMRTTLFGETFDAPIGFAPVGSQRAFHPEGELASARAAHTRNAPQILSTSTSTALEEVNTAREQPVWFHLHPSGAPEVSEQLLTRALAADTPVIVFTIDRLPGGMRRETNQRYAAMDTRDCSACHDPSLSFSERLAQEVMFQGIDTSPVKSPSARWVRWDYIARLRDLVGDRKLVLKGIVTGEDAAIAVDYGVDGIIVSNHGGRAEESLIGTVEVLPEVVAAVDGRIPVLIDGGVRRGSDVFKALALGASGVFIGRPYCWGLAAMGQEGVEGVLDILTQELEQTMAVAGCPDIAAITPDRVTKIS